MNYFANLQEGVTLSKPSKKTPKNIVSLLKTNNIIHLTNFTSDDGSVISDHLNPVKLSTIRALMVHGQTEVLHSVDLVQLVAPAVLQLMLPSVVIDLEL